MDESNKEHVARLKKEYVNLELTQMTQIEMMGLSYEDLRTHAANQFQRIKELERIEFKLRKELADQIEEKKRYIKMHEDKVRECEALRNRLDEKVT